MKTFSPKVLAFGCTALMLVWGLCLWSFDRTSDGDSIVSASSKNAPLDPVARSPQASRVSRKIERPFLVRPPDLFVARDEDASRKYRHDQAKELFGTLRRKLSVVKLMSPDKNPESVSIQMAEYLSGWVDGVVRGAPDLVDDFALEVEDTLCSRDQDPALMLMTFRLVTQMPELGGDKAFDCVFADRKHEDVVLWSGLDAWRASDLPKSAALTSLEQNATDERTRAHLLPHRGLPPGATPEFEASANINTPETTSANEQMSELPPRSL
jgi:hypothetical protein